MGFRFRREVMTEVYATQVVRPEPQVAGRMRKTTRRDGLPEVALPPYDRACLCPSSKLAFIQGLEPSASAAHRRSPLFGPAFGVIWLAECC